MISISDMMKVYIYGNQTEDGLCLPLSSAIVAFLANYCRSDTFRVHICFVKGEIRNEWIAHFPVDCTESLTCSFMAEKDVPVTVRQCVFPVIQVKRWYIVFGM